MFWIMPQPENAKQDLRFHRFINRRICYVIKTFESKNEKMIFLLHVFIRDFFIRIINNFNKNEKKQKKVKKKWKKKQIIILIKKKKSEKKEKKNWNKKIT